MAPRVSVLIPVYNCAPWIGQAIESVLAQSYQDFEIIVADDGSTDQTAQIVQRFPRVRYCRQSHTGVAAARNLALSRARGDLITFLDGDDLWQPDKLQLQVTYLQEHPECKIVFGRYRNFTDIPEENLTPNERKLLRTEVPLALTVACVRKELFDRYGNFNTQYPHAEDTEWTARIQMAHVDCSHHLEQPLYLRRVHNANITLTHNDAGVGEFYALMAKMIQEKLKKEKQESKNVR